MESIKQEIVNNVYENGEQLITGPVLQEVLLDIVDDYNGKIRSGSVPQDLVGKTGSWDDAADWIEDNSGSLVHTSDLEGYATEQWVEDQGYLKEHQDISGLATTQSLNELSESVAQSIADIPEVDLSGYATTESVETLVNETSESVKEWVEAQRYLTSASLSGSVTEETVGFMINDATASVKEWVEDKNYATETFVSESIAGLDIPSTEGFATTESLNQLSESVASDFANLDIPDVSGLATSESVSALSESVRSLGNQVNGFGEDLDTLNGTVAGLASTSSLNSLSKSIAIDLGLLDERVTEVEETKADEESVYNILAGTGLAEPEYGEWTIYDAAKEDDLREVSSSLSASIAAITGSNLSGYATTESVSNLSESVAESIASIQVPDVSGFLPTSSYLVDSASFDQRIDSIVVPDVTGLATTESVNQLSSSFDERINNIITGSGVDLSGYATTESVNQLSESVASDFANLDIPDVSIYATTSSLNSVSESLSASIAAITSSGGGECLWQKGTGNLEYSLQPSGSEALGTAATKVGAIALGSGSKAEGIFSVAQGKGTRASGQYSHAEGYNTIASGDYSHAEGDLTIASGISAHAEGDRTRALGHSSHAEGSYTSASGQHSHAEGTYTVAEGSGSHAEGTGSVASGDYSHAEGTGSTASGISSHAEGELSEASGRASHAEGNNVVASGTWSHAEGITTKAIGSCSHAEGTHTTASGNNSHAEGYYTIASNNSEHAQGRYNATVSGQLFSVGAGHNASNRKNAISVITGSGTVPSASIYVYGVGTYDGTNPQPGVNDLATVISASSGGGNYLPLAGGTLTGNLKVNASIGVGVNPGGSYCLVVGGSGTEANSAHNSVVVGENCHASVWNAFAAGRENRVEGKGAFGAATGFRCKTIAMAGYAGGCRSTASGEFATAIGFGAEAAAKGQVVLGAYNVVDRASGTGSYAVIFGNGKSSTWNQDNPGDIVRSNALAIKWDGGIDITYSGSIITLQEKIAELEARIAALESGSNA